MRKNLAFPIICLFLLSSCSIFDPNSNKVKLKGKRIDVIGYEDNEVLIKKAIVDNGCQFIQNNPDFKSTSIKLDVLQSYGLDNNIVIANDKIIDLTSYGELRAYSLDLKTKIWSHKINNANKMIFIGAMSYDNDNLYVSYGSNRIIAITLNDGKIKWSTTIDDIAKSPPLVHKGKIFVQTTSNHLYAINQTNGAILWRHSENTADFKSSNILQPLVINNTLYMQVDGREITALNLDTGFVEANISIIDKYGFRSANNKKSFVNFFTAEGNRIYSIANNGELVAIDIETQSTLWRSKIFLQAAFLIHGDYIYIISENNYLIALNKKDGKIKWISSLSECMSKKKDGLWVSPIIYKNQIVLVHYSGLMIAFDQNSGKALWKKDDLDMMTNKPVVLNDKIYASSNNGRTYCYYK